MQTWKNGDRVQHTRWSDRTGAPQRGTVRVFTDPRGRETGAEVQWDGVAVADELDLVADHLIRIRG